MVYRKFFVLLLIGVLGTIHAQDFYVVAPNTLRLNSDEIIAVAVGGDKAAVVRILIQDHPGKLKNITQTFLTVHPDQPEKLKVHLSPSNFPPNFLNAPGSPKLISLRAQSDTFQKEFTIPISTQSGYVFIQTDKPIYTPKQRVLMRIISLNENFLRSQADFKLQIKNPNGNIVEEKVFSPRPLRTRTDFLIHTYKFPIYPIFGEWSATVFYGYEFQQNNTVRFDLEEYVLPTFTVELETPHFILPSTERIKIKVLSKYVYGKKVRGMATFRFGVMREEPEATFFGVIGPKYLDDGAVELTLKMDEMKNRQDIGWFPAIDGSRLVVEASVVDDATGNKEVAVDAKGRFTISPFTISFKRCFTDFKPGSSSVFEADIFYVSGRPAVGIEANIKALADNRPLQISRSTAVSDENGKVAFRIQTEPNHSTISVTIETNDPRYNGSQAKGNFMQRKFESSSKVYISLERNMGQRLKPGDMFRSMVYSESRGLRDIYYLVVARGEILLMNKCPRYPIVEFEITHEMVPSFRVLVFAHYQNELIADSLKIEVERVCKPEAQVTVEPEFNVQEPGQVGKFTIRGNKGTSVGLLAVDEAVYALSTKGLLTKSKVFDKFETHDLGCGPGGGLNVDIVLGNAGIIIATKDYTSSLAHTCVETKRRKREAAFDIISNFTGVDKMCCSLGMEKDKHNRNCEERTNIVEKVLEGEYENCSRLFLECCKHAEENEITDINIEKQDIELARSRGEHIDKLGFMRPENQAVLERHLTVRSDFRETWIFEDFRIGADNTKKHAVSLPHSITTWIIQAISFSATHGICVSEPQNLVAFKKIFLHLNLPYSVVQNEQVEIQATVFNYGYKPITAVMYMYGIKDLCTGSQPGERSEQKILTIDAESAANAFFPVIPLKAENFLIKFAVFSAEGSDVIVKTLHVVHAGVPHQIDITLKLDPTNQQKRNRVTKETEYYLDTIYSDQGQQVTAVKLITPEGFVPGTASCSITALGDQLGQVIDTCINNPESLLILPSGCGEQNMMRLAPTLYTVRYLKVTGKLTPETEEKGYDYIRTGYDNQLKYRKEDGSYAAFEDRQTNGWLTAFVMKVLCQAKELVYIDPDVLCSGVKWLVNNQESDGSFTEKYPLYAVELMGGVKGKTPMTAFTLIALQECQCDDELHNLNWAKMRAVAYLEMHLGDVNTPLPAAIVAYALALSDSELKYAANDKLLSMMKTDEDSNTMYWTTPDAAQDIETAGYGLMTQLLFNDLDRSNAIANWLKAQQLQSGSYKSTQDTVVALQALSEHAMTVQLPAINLVANITSSNDRKFHRVLTFDKNNALILKDEKVDKVGGTLFITTTGQGVASLAVKLRYNLMAPEEEICKFDVIVEVSETRIEKKKQVVQVKDSRGRRLYDKYPDDRIRGVAIALDEDVPVLEFNPFNRGENVSLESESVISTEKLRIKRESSSQQNNTLGLKIALCIRYLGNSNAGMSIVDVGIFSGFEPVIEDLERLQADLSQFILRYEKSGRGVVFYLEKVPMDQNYCFSFRVVRKFIVGKTQASVIKVYDYYNPDAKCTKFYSPNNHSPMLKTICEGGICSCAEGGCPPRNPFSSISDETDDRERRENLAGMLCEKYDYVWIGKLYTPMKKEGGFLNISFLITEVIKEGIEKKNLVEGNVRNLLARDNCESTSPVIFDVPTYLVLGRDGEQYRNSKGVTWYRYMLDKNSAVHVWTSVEISPDRQLQRDLDYVTNKLKTRGCQL